MRILDAMEERFCQLVAQDVDAAEAYVAAGFPGPCGKAAQIAADRLMVDADIRDRIEAIKDASYEEDGTTVSKERICKELWQTYLRSTAAGQHVAANRALELLGKEKGMFSEAKKKGKDQKKIGDMSLEELRVIIASDARGKNRVQ